MLLNSTLQTTFLPFTSTIPPNPIPQLQQSSKFSLFFLNLPFPKTLVPTSHAMIWSIFTSVLGWFPCFMSFLCLHILKLSFVQKPSSSFFFFFPFFSLSNHNLAFQSDIYSTDLCMSFKCSLTSWATWYMSMPFKRNSKCIQLVGFALSLWDSLILLTVWKKRSNRYKI
jgi:hypothetical protein